MNTVVAMIAIYFVSRFLFGLGGSRNIDQVLPWLRIGTRWRAHKILPVLIFVPFVAWIEGWIGSVDPWPHFTSVKPRVDLPTFPVAAPTLPGLAPLDKSEHLQSPLEKRMEMFAKQQAKQNAPKRTLASVLPANDLAALGPLPEISFPSSTEHIDIFAVQEEQTARAETVASGWRQRLTKGMQGAKYTVITRCGFDLSVQPAERVCYSALPTPVFMNTAHTNCDPKKIYGKKTTKLNNRTVLTYNRFRQCDYKINLPWVLLRMDATGISATACVFNSLIHNPEACDNGSISIGLAGASRDGILDWAQYNRNGETIALELKRSENAEAEPLGTIKWSQRQIMRNHQSVLKPLQPKAEPFGTIRHDVSIPMAHLAAMNFLGVRFAAKQVEPAWRVTREVKRLILSEQSTVRGDASNPNTCRALLDPRRNLLRLGLTREGNSKARIKISSATRVSKLPALAQIDALTCPGILPLFLSKLLR